MKNPVPPICRMLLLAAAWLSLTFSTRAGLIAQFKIDEGAIDNTTNTTSSADSVFTGTLAGGVPPTWLTSDLAPLLVAQSGTVGAITNSSLGGHILTDFWGTNSSGASVLGTNARTVTAWVRIPAAPTATAAAYVVTYGSASATVGGRFSLRLDTTAGTTLGKIRLEISSGSVVGTNTVIADNNWHHLAAVCQTGCRMSNTLLYVDGNLQQNFTTTPSVLINTVTNFSPVQIGLWTVNGNPSTFLGAIDDVRIYDEALSGAQVAELVYGPGNAPGITAQPANQTALLGATNASVTFNVGVSGSPTIRYQWKKNGVNVPNATNQTLTIQQVVASSMASYSVGVTNNYGGILSSPATLSWATPAVDPLEKTILVGSNASFAVSMPGESSGYTYAWRKGITPTGATASTMTVSAATLGDAGSYNVVVTLSGQSATSAPVALNVLSGPAGGYPQLVLSDSPAAYWRLGELNGAFTATDVTGFHAGSYSNYSGSELEAGGAIPGDANTASTFGGANWVEVPYSAALHHNSAFSLEAWITATSPGGRQSIICSRNQYFSSGYELALNGTSIQFRTGSSTSPASEIWTDLNGTTPINDTDWHHVVATFDGSTKRLYLDGVLIGTQAATVLPTPVPLRLGAGLTYLPTPGNYFAGTLDEVALYSSALSASQVAQHFSAGKFGNNTPPQLVQVPTGATRYLGSDYTLFVSAQGSFPLTYQWTHAGTNLPGATSSSLVLTDLQAASAGNYTVNITNAVGFTNSAAVALTLIAPPATGYVGVIMADKPAAYFPLDDTNNSPTAIEAYNFGLLDGTYNNSPLLEQSGATPNTGKSVTFDGVMHSMTFGNPPALDFTGRISLEAWVKPEVLYTTSYGDIVAHGYSAAPATEVVLRMYNGEYQVSSFDAGGAHGAGSAVPPGDIGAWVHLVGTYDGVAWNLYRNGLLVSRATNATGAVTVDADWAIASRGAGDLRLFQGGIDEVAIYNHDLSPAQIGNHYLTGAGTNASVSITSSGGNITVAWNAGGLEEATSITGPWAALPTAVSPLTVPASGAGKFYRVRR